MATLILTAVGSAIGGPIGGAIGALVGQQADRLIFGGGSRQGPRLRELAISTSSYGQPIARHFGRVRVPGTVIWSTDLIETRRKDKGRKGQPSTVNFSYSASFAVALSSTPIARLGRIWADGNLLRGAADDLKVGGTLRIYRGHGDDPIDPLIAAARGGQALAFRDCAYALFENLELADFGNRIPALSFELFADDGAAGVSLTRLIPAAMPTPAILPQALGFADEGGPIAGTLATIDQVIPLVCTSGQSGLTIVPRGLPQADIITLPQQLAAPGSSPEETRHNQRAGPPAREPAALRYYDEARDYQPGVQRAVGIRRAGREQMIELPATMTASGARRLANDSANRSRWQQETVTWRIGDLNPAHVPGAIVRIPEMPGYWLVQSWEWLDRGIELVLERLAPGASTPLASDPGDALQPPDLVIPETRLVATEVPADANINPATPLIYAAVSAENSAWRGAAIFAVEGTALVDIGTSGSQRAVIGTLEQSLPPSSALLFEPRASAVIKLVADDLELSDSSLDGLAGGANRMLIGSEVVQFASAEPLGDRLWQLTGLLRGRGGTEHSAARGQPAQTIAVLLDDRLITLDPGLVPPLASTRIAAIGTGDTDAVIAPLANAGLSRRPLCPVHAKLQIAPDGTRNFSWTRRARGQWRWDNAVDVPLVEEREAYRVGYGPLDTPLVNWDVSVPQFQITQPDLASLVAAHGPSDLWVRQIGTFDMSPALLLGVLS
jgi:hypothetical protein